MEKCIVCGKEAKSIKYHIFGPLVVLFCLYILVNQLIEWKRKKVFFINSIIKTKVQYLLWLFLIIYYIIRLMFFLKENSINDILIQSIWK